MEQLKQKERHWCLTRLSFLFLAIIILSTQLGCKRILASQMNAGIYLSENEYDFGIISDTINEVFCEVALVNKTEKPCKIIDIIKACGCTNVEVESKTIPPNGSTRIYISLNFGNNYGFIEKNIYLYTNQKEEPLSLSLRATRDIPYGQIEKDFPVAFGDYFRLTSSTALLGYVQQGRGKSFAINILNTSDYSHELSLSSDLPECFSVIIPQIIKPHEISRIVVTYSPNNNIWGQNEFDLVLKDEKDYCFPIRVYAIVTEKFDKGKKTPRIFSYFSAYDHKIVACKGKVQFKIYNVGQEILSIRNIQCSDYLVKPIMDKKICPVGDSCCLYVLFPFNYPFNDKVVIGISTNDKIEPYKEYYIE